jgi:hypothetical protein
MKEVAIRFIGMLGEHSEIPITTTLAGVAVAIILSIYSYNVKSNRSDNDAKVNIYKVMTDRGYTEVQTAGSPNTHWEKK